MCYWKEQQKNHLDSTVYFKFHFNCWYYTVHEAQLSCHRQFEYCICNRNVLQKKCKQKQQLKIDSLISFNETYNKNEIRAKNNCKTYIGKPNKRTNKIRYSLNCFFSCIFLVCCWSKHVIWWFENKRKKCHKNTDDTNDLFFHYIFVLLQDIKMLLRTIFSAKTIDLKNKFHIKLKDLFF